jgi:hypothetical protein
LVELGKLQAYQVPANIPVVAVAVVVTRAQLVVTVAILLGLELLVIMHQGALRLETSVAAVAAEVQVLVELVATAAPVSSSSGIIKHQGETLT